MICKTTAAAPSLSLGCTVGTCIVERASGFAYGCQSAVRDLDVKVSVLLCMIVLNTCISCDRVNTQYLLALATFHVPRGDALVHSLSVSHTSHAHTRYFPAWSCSELTAGHVRLCPGLCQVDPRPLLQARQAQVSRPQQARAPPSPAPWPARHRTSSASKRPPWVGPSCAGRPRRMGPVE